jgi:lipoprotein-anchoring transpeptidase ErfK/SrfK
MGRFTHWFQTGGALTWALGAATATAVGAVLWDGSQALLALRQRDRVHQETAGTRALVTTAQRRITALRDSVARTQRTNLPPAAAPVIIVSLAENRLWVRDGGEDIFTTRVASGSGRTLIGSGRNQQYKFDTPRGKLTVRSKETAPAWVPPDWHFVEKAGKRGLGLLRMQRGTVIPVSDGVITTRGSDVVKKLRDGTTIPLTASDGRELIVGGRMLIPPGGTNARRYKEILGTHRLNLGDGYALHGTNAPTTIGRSVSHGCVRLRNEDIETLYKMIPVGTSVYIY